MTSPCSNFSPISWPDFKNEVTPQVNDTTPCFWTPPEEMYLPNSPAPPQEGAAEIAALEAKMASAMSPHRPAPSNANKTDVKRRITPTVTPTEHCYYCHQVRPSSEMCEIIVSRRQKLGTFSFERVNRLVPVCATSCDEGDTYYF